MLFSCTQKSNDLNESKYRIVFASSTGMIVDLNSKILKVDFVDLKFKDTLKFTPSETKLLWQSFNESGLFNQKGTIIYDPLMLTTPSSSEILQIFKDNKIASVIHINSHYSLDTLPISDMYRAIRFKNVIVKLLNKDSVFVRARKRYQKYRKDNFMLDL